jgi:hypothetical protein
MFHEKANGIAAASAAKTLIDLLGGGDGEGRRFLVMERAEAKVVGAAFFELHEAAHDLDDIDPA